MHPLTSLLLASDFEREARQRADAELRAMSARRDALPLPPGPASVGLLSRITTAVRRIVLRPAAG